MDGVTLHSARWRRDAPALLPDPDADIEWWFVQGQLSRPGLADLNFMVAFFQVRSAPGARPAHMLLTQVIDGDGGNARASSRMSSGIVDLHGRIARSVAETNFSRRLSGPFVRRHMQDALKIATRQGIEIVPDAAQVRPGALDIRWQDFALCAEGGGFRLDLPLPDGDRAELLLAPEAVWLSDDGRRLDPDLCSPFAYNACPRLAVSGRIGPDRADGRAWVENQSGQLAGWFVDRDAGRSHLVGWDWLGLSLDNGCDLLAMRHFRIGDRDAWRGFTICFDGDGARRLEGGLTDVATTSWTSPVTGARYPVGRRLVLEEIGADLVIEPLTQDQEVPVFGALGIWEGAVTAQGQCGGRRVSGTGRLELFGYGYAETIGGFFQRSVRRRFTFRRNGVAQAAGA